MKVSADRIAHGLWWDRAWSLVEGCSRVSPGCDNCWAATQTHMRSKQKNQAIRSRYALLTANNGKFNGNTRLMYHAFDIPSRVKKSTTWAVWNDLYHESVPFNFIELVYREIYECKQHTFVVLTKRPERALAFKHYFYKQNKDLSPIPNLIDGFTAENQTWYDERWEFFEVMKKRRWTSKFFWSVEPMLTPIDFKFHQSDSKPDFIVFGSESGSADKVRPFDINWLMDANRQCDAHQIKVFNKQITIEGKLIKDLSEFPPPLQRRELI